MGVMALKTLMRDIQRHAEFSAHHMNISMPALFKSHGTRYKEIKERIKETDGMGAKMATRKSEYAKLAREYMDEARQLPKDLKKTWDSLEHRRSIRDAIEHARTDDSPESRQLATDLLQSYGSKYARSLGLTLVNDHTSWISIGSTVYKSASYELQALLTEELAPEAKTALAQGVVGEMNALNAFGQPVTVSDILDFVDAVKER